MSSSETVDVRRFTTTFRFLLTNAHADGFTFTVQGEGPHALGGPGGGLGYGPDPSDPLDPGFRVTQSVAVKFDLFNNDTLQEVSLVGLYKNGASPTGGGDTSLAADGIDLHSGNHFHVSIEYDGTTLKMTITDEKTLASAVRNFSVDIPAETGPTAHVGVTAGTGGYMETQDGEIVSIGWHQRFPGSIDEARKIVVELAAALR